MVTVEIFVVSYNECFDFCIHKGMYVKEVIFLLARLLCQIKKEDQLPNHRFRLGSYRRNIILERDRTLEFYEIEEGDRLFLF